MLTVTPEAKTQIQALLKRADSPQTALRVFVSPGGCSGMSYGMTLDDQEQEGDQLIEEDGVRRTTPLRTVLDLCWVLSVTAACVARCFSVSAFKVAPRINGPSPPW